MLSPHGLRDRAGAEADEAAGHHADDDVDAEVMIATTNAGRPTIGRRRSLDAHAISAVASAASTSTGRSERSKHRSGH